MNTTKMWFASSALGLMLVGCNSSTPQPPILIATWTAQPSQAVPLTTIPTDVPTADGTDTPAPTSAPNYPTIDLSGDYEYLQDGGAIPESALARLGIGKVRGIESLDGGSRILLETEAGLYVYETKTFERVWRKYFERQPNTISVSPDRTRITTNYDWDSGPDLYDAATGAKIANLPGWYEAAWSPNSTLIAVQEEPDDPETSTIGRILLYNGVTGALERALSAPINGYYGPVFWNVDWSPDGHYVAACSLEDGFFLWSASTASRLQTVLVKDLPDKSYESIDCVGFDQQSQYYLIEAIGNNKTQFSSVSIETGEMTPVDFEPGLLRGEFEVEDGKTIQIIDSGGLDSLGRQRYSPDGTKVAGRTGATGLNVWRFASRKLLYTIDTYVGYVDWSPEGTWLIALGDDSVIYDGETGTQKFAPLSSDSQYAFLDDNHLIISDGFQVNIVDLQSGHAEHSARLNLRPWTLQWSQDGHALCIARPDATWLWSEAGGVREVASCNGVGDRALVHRFTNSDMLEAASPDGQLRAAVENYSACGDGPSGGGCGIWGGNLKVLEGEKIVFEKGEGFFSGGGASGLTWSSDSQMLAVAQTYPVLTLANSAILIFNPRTGEELFNLQGHVLPVTTLLFSPDGTRLASVSDDGTIIIWNTAR